MKRKKKKVSKLIKIGGDCDAPESALGNMNHTKAKLDY